MVILYIHLGVIKVLLKPYKPLLSTYSFKIMFVILFFPKKRKMYSNVNLKILKLHPPYFNLPCLLFFQNISELGENFRNKNTKVNTKQK